MLGLRLSRWVWLVTAWVLLGACAPVARAAPADVDIVDEDFGFCDGLVPERWTPLRLNIASRKEPFSGRLTVSYAQDGTQGAQVELAVATTLGQVTPIEVAVCAPESLSQITFTFEHAQTGRIRRIRYERWGSNREDPDVRDLPPDDMIGRRVVMFDGPRGLDEALAQRSAALTAPSSPAEVYPGQAQVPAASPWLATWRANLPRERMPLSWVAYDCADAVVVRGDVGIGANVVDSRAFEALMAWVKSGGKLVVLVETAGDGWARFVGGAGMVEVGELETRAIPSRARGVLLAPGDPEEGPDAKAGFAAADQVAARWIGVTELGKARGWSVEYPIAALPATGPSKSGQSLGVVAIGPVGFGTVMLVSCDPGKMPAVVGTSATTRLWRDILSIILDRGSPRYVPDQNSWAWRFSGKSSGANETERVALETVFSKITRVPSLGHGTFIAIAVVVLVLALLVGPVDAIVLRRKGLRQHSWATALLWIAVASAASVAAPMLIRSSEDRAFRLASYDAILGGNGGVEFACREGATTILPGKGGAVRLKDSGNGVVYRGASPIARRPGEGFTGSVLHLEQRLGERGTLRGVMPGVLALRQWSTRTMLDECPEETSPAISALRVELDLDKTCVLHVKGLAEKASLLRASVQTKQGWWVLTSTNNTGEWSDAGPAQRLPSADWSAASGSERYFHGADESLSAFVGIGNPGASKSLPLSGTRTDTIDRLVASGEWACVHLHVLDWPMDVAIEPAVGWKTESQAVLRVLVPLRKPSEPAAPAASTPPDETTP